jgi:hypothetical protein
MREFEPLLTEIDAARLLSRAPGTLRNWRSKNEGPPFIKVGASVRYSLSSLRDYIEIHTRCALSSGGKAA